MNPNKFYSEKSALLTALLAQVQSCRHTLEAIQRLDATSAHGADSDVLHLDQLTDDLAKLTEGLRDAVDAMVRP